MNRRDIEKEKVKRLAKWIKGKKAPPVRIDIEPTSTCNLKCRFCWTTSQQRLKSRQYEKLLSEERIIEIVKEGGKLGVVEWQIAGGWEPLTKPKLLMEMAEVIKEYGMYGCITTNGTLFTEEMIKRLVEIGWDEILFSLEGPNASIHDYITRVKGSFKASVTAMKKFAEWKRKLGTTKPNYSFHSVLTNKNFDKLSEMVKLGFKLGCTGVNFEPLSVWSEECEKLKLSKRQEIEVKKHAKNALKLAGRLGIFTNLKNLLQPKLIEKSEMDKILKANAKKFGIGKLIGSPCFEPWLSLEIRITGRVAPCRICDDDANCERIFTKSLEEIWFGEYFQQFRENMKKWKMPSYCYTCAAGNVVNMQIMREELARFIGA